MNLVIYAGTFNPIHTAHLIIAQVAKDELKADKVVFIPAHIPPHRETDLATPQDRLEMVKLAIKNNKDFEVSDIEYQYDEKSYSLLTLQRLKEIYPTVEKFNFIIGTDAFEKIDSWYKPEEVAKLAKFIIVKRHENFDKDEFFSKIKLKDFDYEIIKAPLLEISSSSVRNLICQNKSIKYQVASEVEQYIMDNKLYL